MMYRGSRDLGLEENGNRLNKWKAVVEMYHKFHSISIIIVVLTQL